MELERFSALVLAWQRLAADTPAEGFRSAALTLLEPAVGFDSAWWGVANPQAGHASVLEGTLLHLPPEFVEDWWRIADFDALARLVAEHPGMTVLDDALRACTPQEEAFDARYGLSCALSTVLPDEATGLASFVSLYRGPGRPGFGEAERARVQLLMPHLVQAEQAHWRLSLRRRFVAGGDHEAVADETGYLVHATPDFCQALLREFPGWPGGPLPAPLQPLLAARQGLWQGEAIELAAAAAEAEAGEPSGHCRLTLRTRIGHGLTRREESIARAYAAGDSYKEIARRFGLSPATVRGYLRECYLKLGVSNKAALGGVLRRELPPASRA